MRRHCGRPGCNAVATATFSFDATRCVVWLNPIEDGMPRAGDLCTRHADGMAPPKGWDRVDHRNEVGAELPDVVTAPSIPAVPAAVTSDDLLPVRQAPKPKRKPATKKRWHEVPNLFEEPTTAPTAQGAVNLAPPAAVVGGGVIVAPDAAQVLDPAHVTAAVDRADPVPPVDPVDEPTSWMPRYATDEDLGDVLDASTPLLSRAFNHARPSDDAADIDDRSAPGHAG